jgi:Na+/phosphate symporter
MTAPRIVEDPDEKPSEAASMCRPVLEMLKWTRTGFVNMDPGALDAAEHVGAEIHRQEKRLLTRLSPPLAGFGPAAADQESLFVPMHLERVGDNLERFIGAIRKKMIREGVLFTPRARDEMRELLDLAIELVECVHDALVTANRTLVRHVLEQGERYERQAGDFAFFHEQRVIEGACVPSASSVYLAMLDHLKGVEWHIRQIALKLSSRALVEEKETGSHRNAGL